MGKFDGYYIKTTDKSNSVGVIFGKNKNRKNRSSFIQIITADKTFNTVYDYKDYKVTKKPFSVQIGKNKASESGLHLDFGNYSDDPNTGVKADLTFGAFSPIRYDAMGYFRFFPFMECKHKVISMDHTASGQIQLGDQLINFEKAKGYIEGDTGKSFPKKYFWSQCNLFDEKNEDLENEDDTHEEPQHYGNLSIMASCARIPYLGIRFTGTICIIHHNGLEHRLATYRRAKVKSFTENKLIIKQGKKILEITVPDPDKNRHDLFAPNRGKMDRFIKETVTTTVHYKFTIKKETIFDIQSNNAAFEFSIVEKDKNKIPHTRSSPENPK